MSTKVDFTPDDFMAAANVAILRLHRSLCDKRKDTLYEKRYSDHLRGHFLGACGEVAVAKLLGLHWAGTVDAFKDKPDILPNIEVRHRFDHKHDLIVRHDDPGERIYVLSTGDPPDIYVHGWMHGEDAKNDKWLRNYGGHKPAFFVPQKFLHDLETLNVT